MGQTCIDDEDKAMRSWIRNLITGAGSIMVISPAPSPARYNDLLPSESIEDTLRGDWRAVGDDIAWAMEATGRKGQWVEQAEESANEASNR